MAQRSRANIEKHDSMGRTILLLIALSFTVATGLVSSAGKLQTAVARHSQASRGTLSMKLFDWKRREADESAFATVDSVFFTEDNLRPAPGSKPRKHRKGRGIAAGQGATCGFGMRGQKSRAGRPSRPGFEGGQNPLYRRTPKMRGRPLGPGHKRTIYHPIQLEVLNQCPEGSTVNFESLREAKLITKQKIAIHKIVGGGELTTKGLTVQAHAFTESAKAAIEGNGGKCVVLSPTTGEVVAEE